MVSGIDREVRNCVLGAPFSGVLSGRETRGGGSWAGLGKAPEKSKSGYVGHSEQTELSILSFQRGDPDPPPSWMPCTRLWLAVSSCGESPQHWPPQHLHSPTPSSSPAEATGPAYGHLGQPDLHQTSLQISLTTTRPASMTSLTTIG